MKRQKRQRFTWLKIQRAIHQAAGRQAEFLMLVPTIT
jgi:hypothetical protein